MSSAPSYEAYCPHCDVSHPPGTRRCVHCGNEVMKHRPPTEAKWRRTAPAEELPGVQPGEAEEAEQEAPPRRTSGPLRLAISLVWILAAVAITLYRACTGQ